MPDPKAARSTQSKSKQAPSEPVPDPSTSNPPSEAPSEVEATEPAPEGVPALGDTPTPEPIVAVEPPARKPEVPVKRRRSRILLVCPISGRQADPIDYTADAPEGEWFEVDPGEPLDLQVGWGRMTIERAIPNPEIKRVLAERAEHIEEAMNLLKAALQDPKTSPENRREIRTMIQSGQARLEVEQRAEDALPLPASPLALQRMVFPVLAPETLKWTFDALAVVGFPIETPQE